MTQRVIDGGIIDPHEPVPIVWNRQPIDAQRVALVIRDAPLVDCRDRVDVAWDDGRPFLIGIRSIRLPENPAALEAWRALAALIGAEIRDERRTPDPFATADAENARKAVAERLERESRLRGQRRTHNPLPAGSLFDDVTQAQGGLNL